MNLDGFGSRFIWAKIPREDPPLPAAVAPPLATIGAHYHLETTHHCRTKLPPLESATSEPTITGKRRKTPRLFLLAGADSGHCLPRNWSSWIHLLTRNPVSPRRPTSTSCRRSSSGHHWSSLPPGNDAPLPDKAPAARISHIGAHDHRKTAKNSAAFFARWSRFRPLFAAKLVVVDSSPHEKSGGDRTYGASLCGSDL
ncbi:hypothetical protein PanWU01x14_114130 [Parasponia andersonii]|uniref:Uncharacterized protein n=1 Tax=Parasponia andersonii TaxID=3476 RepID=A0A2P5CX94_PARAD|nr:hypothetical protein PanWU01x14_114130 [Parasponia andersonii]